MSRNLRRVIFLTFVFLFFVSGSILLIYANGYRYHIGKRTIEKTGQLLVETQPKGAHIFLNGSSAVAEFTHEAYTTPATVPYLFSGEYLLTVRRDGFHDWSDKVSISSGRTTIINDIIMIKNSPPTLLSAQSHIRAAQEVSGGILFDDGTTVSLFDTRSESVRLLATSPTPIDGLQAAPSGANAIIHTVDTWQIVGQGKTGISLKDAQKKYTSFRWAEHDDTLYSLDAKGITVYDPDKKVLSPFASITDGVDLFADDEVAVLRQGSKPALVFFDRKTGTQNRVISPIPSVTGIWGSSNGLLILKGANESFYLIDRNAVRPVFQYVSDAKNILFSSANHFFSYNDFELWTHDFSNDRYTRSLVTRQSKVLSLVVPLETIPFIVTISSGGDIRIRDLRADDATAETPLALFDSVNTIIPNQKETTLFVFGSFKGQEGIYSVPLTEQEELFPLVK